MTRSILPVRSISQESVHDDPMSRPPGSLHAGLAAWRGKRATGPLRWLVFALPLLAGVVGTAQPVELRPSYQGRQFILRADEQPADFRYLAFPSVLPISADEIWIACKAGAKHATDAGAAIVVVSHRLSTGETRPIARLRPEPPKLYQMAEWVRFPNGAIALYLDVHAIGHDNRHYRTGAEIYSWDAQRRAFGPPTPLPPIGGVTYGYPFDFVSAGPTTWQLIMSFGYLPGGRWSVDAVRSDDNGGSWRFVRNLSAEFGNLRLNESAFVRHGDGFIVTTRGYDARERLHRTDAEFKVRKQVDLTGTYSFLNSYIGRPRLFIRDGKGYLIGRNWNRPLDAPAERGGKAGAMKLCLFRFDLETLAITAYSVLDNAEEDNVTDGYYAVPVFSERDGTTWLHVVTYKGRNQQPPDIVRLDYRWAEIK